MAMTAREKAEAKLKDLEEKERAATMRRKEQEKALATEIAAELQETKRRIGEAALSVHPELEHLTASELTHLFSQVFSLASSSGHLEGSLDSPPNSNHRVSAPV